MLMRMIYDEGLAQAAYLIGCPALGEAIVIDPERDVDRYLELAKREGLKIVAAAETHIHADFLSGVRELCERVGAKAYVSGEGPDEWRARWVGKYPHQFLKDGDTIRIGGVEIKAMHTPGHTPEHLAFVVSEGSGGPMAVASGDFVFVGDLGRPDLLETAAGISGTKEAGAEQLFASVQKFVKLPEYLQVWPGHGAGSACGKALGAVPSSTVGYEVRTNPAIRAAGGAPTSPRTGDAGDRASSARGEVGGTSRFVEYILAGQPEPPSYFARMKRQNRDGVPLLGALPRPAAMTAAEVAKLDGRRVAIIDTRLWAAFKAGHLEGALRMPLDKTFSTVAGAYVREDEDIYLVVEGARVEEAVRGLVRVGLDRVKGFVEPSQIDAYRAAGGKLVGTDEVDVAGAKERMARGALVLDVRKHADEFAPGHIPGAANASYTRLAESMERLPRDREIVVACQGGGRSSRAAAYLQRAGFKVANLAGGFEAWQGAGEKVERA